MPIDRDRVETEVRVVVIDDDCITRQGLRTMLATCPSINVIAAPTLAEAEGWTREWQTVDWAIVDILDEARKAGEPGTDVYTGVEVIRRACRYGAGVETIAITPDHRDPLLGLRIADSGAGYVYERREFSDPRRLIDAVRRPCPRRAPIRHPWWVLQREGLGPGARPNRAVDAFRASGLYGRLDANLTQASIGPRRASIALRDAVSATGFLGSGVSPRWNEIRDYLLKLTGRLAVEPSPLREWANR